MPRIQRSPPTTAKTNVSEAVLETDLMSTNVPTNTNIDASNVSVRSKRPRLEESPNNSTSLKDHSGDLLVSLNQDERNPILDDDIVSELRKEIISTITLQLKASFKSYFENEFVDLKNTLNELKSSVQFMSNDFDEIKSELSKNRDIVGQLKKENLELKTCVTDLSVRVNLLEQYSRQENVEINGVPENQAENLVSTMVQLGKAVSCSIETTDVLNVTRVKKLDSQNNRPRTIVAKLRNTTIRDVILASVMKFNRAHATDKLNSSHLGYGGTKQPVFVSEHLSPINKAIHAETRKIAREKGYKYVWVRDGRILVRKNEGARAIHIKNLQAVTLL